MSVEGIAGVLGRIAQIEQRFGPVAGFAQAAAASQAPAGATAAAPVADIGTQPAGTPAAGALQPPAPRVPAAPTGGPSGAAPAASQAWHTEVPAAGKRWLGDIERAAGAAGIDPRLLASVVQVESGFRQDVRSHAGAIGLGQLMPGTARGLGVDPHDPQQNLAGAARYLREQLDRFGSVELALAAYNAGPNRVARAGGVPRITETQNYVRKVGAIYDDLRR